MSTVQALADIKQNTISQIRDEPISRLVLGKIAGIVSVYDGDRAVLAATGGGTSRPTSDPADPPMAGSCYPPPW